MRAQGISDADVARFWPKVDKRGDRECWDWLASKNERGYGWFVYDDGRDSFRARKAHRFSFAVANGRHPDGYVLHSCDRPSCVNPAHLREGTAADNSDDAARHGRTRALLDVDMVRVIRQLHSAGVSIASIARGCGRGWMTVKKVVSGQTWKHVTP